MRRVPRRRCASSWPSWAARSSKARVDACAALASPGSCRPAHANALRRDAVAALEAARARAFARLPRAAPVEPPVPYPEDTLSYLANVYNRPRGDFYARHGVR
jgi:hypothetical protein